MGLACGNTGNNPNGRVLSKSYDNSTGVLTITNCGQLAGYADSGIPQSLGWQPFSCEAYIVFGDIVRPQ